MKIMVQHQQDEIVIYFLMRLNDTSSTVQSLNLTIDPLPFLNNTYSLILQDGRQRSHQQRHSLPLEGVAMVVINLDNSRGKGCFNGHQNSHFGGRGRGHGSHGCETPRCDCWNNFSHTRDTFRKLNVCMTLVVS
uniref:Uncharacterized protein n=1 Tax=Davidia involucrata TaxID=16924 RepID=A0A5B6YPM1_DAVIN